MLPTPMMGDNDQATNLACEDILTQANRYFRLEYHFCKECFEAGDTSPLRVAGVDNISDVLTKSLAAPIIAKLRPGLTGYEPLQPPPPRQLTLTSPLSVAESTRALGCS